MKVIAEERYTEQVHAHSRFLKDAIARHPDWISDLAESSDSMYRAFGPRDFSKLLGEAPVTPEVLARFRRRQILRIMLRDILGLGTLGDITEELSHLADTIIDSAYHAVLRSIVQKHGEPSTGFAVIALGKLGGQELNYSSDIDLMFVYGEHGESDGQEHPITHKEFFKKAATQLTEMLSTYTPEGMCYRVDLRLRPEGRLGEVCISLDGARQYYEKRARDWELQMMIKARVAGGDRATGIAMLDFIEPLTYSTTLDFSAIEVMSATRERLNEKLSAKKPGMDIKLAPGGIRDIEFLVQCLQRLHGGRFSWLRHGGTLLALSRLQDKALISPNEYSKLASAYQFLRTLEHRLQFFDDRQTHTLPASNEELEALASRMPEVPGRPRSAAALTASLKDHLAQVREIYERVVHAQKHAQKNVDQPPAETASEVLRGEPNNLVRFLDQRAPGLADLLDQSKLRRGHRSFEHFLEKVSVLPDRLHALNTDRNLASGVIDLFECSPYFAEQLIRVPELMEELKRPSEPLDPPPSDPVALRRYFQRHMMRIQADSICHHQPIFATLIRTSDLADQVILKAYQMALEQVVADRPPKNPAYIAKDQLMVIALGRLGMREFDLASDADLNFVIPEAERSEIIFWTRVAERMIDVLAAYTGEGAIFAVDTRLRPSGREGTLVQTDAGYRVYFEKYAEAWEGLAYMKARAVAGNLEAGTDVLGQIQETDWRRWGQTGARRELREMRTRVERDQGGGHPLKAGAGGYYDIDFILMYLRLKGGGIFYRVLNTPDRIDVLEKMGNLDRQTAVFLDHAATFYRSIDHGLRLYSGHAEGNLPNSEAKLEALTELVARWVPEHLRQLPLTQQLESIQLRTRNLFIRYFPG